MIRITSTSCTQTREQSEQGLNSVTGGTPCAASAGSGMGSMEAMAATPEMLGDSRLQLPRAEGLTLTENGSMSTYGPNLSPALRVGLSGGHPTPAIARARHDLAGEGSGQASDAGGEKPPA